MIGFLFIVIAYLLGSIPFGYLLVRWKTGEDVRAKGSGNIGATNVLRTTGRAIGILTLALDIGKGFLAVWLAGRFCAANPFWMSAAALAVIAGHAYPVFLGFKGGKAVATFVGAFLCLTPWPLLATILIFAAVVAVTRFISAGSIIGAGVFPLGVFLIMHPDWPVLAAALLASAFVIWRHKSNIGRLVAGTENVFTFGSKRK